MAEIKNNQSKKIFISHGGTLRTSQALRLGIHPRDLYKLRDEGQILNFSKEVLQKIKEFRKFQVSPGIFVYPSG